MNIAVIADIHGNDQALLACLEYLQDKDIDAFFFLGDYTGEFPGIERTMETLYWLKENKECYFLRGNKEDYQLSGLGEGHPEWNDYPSTIGMIRYGNYHLTQKDKNFFQELPITRSVKFQGLPEIVICHGSPRKVNEKFTEDERKLEEVLTQVRENYIVCGHTHKRKEMNIGEKHVWNPGSLGASIDPPYDYRFMILHGDGGLWAPEFVSLKADVELLIRKMHEAGLYEIAPYWTKMTEHMLRGGGADTHGMLLERAMKICVETCGECIWPKVPEECFQRAFEEMESSSN